MIFVKSEIRPRNPPRNSFRPPCDRRRRALRLRSRIGIGRRGRPRGVGLADGRAVRSHGARHHSENPVDKGRRRRAGGVFACGQRPVDADVVPQSAGGPFRAGYQFGRESRRGIVPVGGAAAGHRRAFVAGQRRYGGRRMDRVGAHPVVDHGCQPPYQGHYGNSDSGNDVRIGRRGARRDSPIHEQRGGSQIVRRLDDGIARRRDDPAADAARAGRGGRYGIDVCRTQTVESAAAGRTLRPHDGAECRPYTHVDLSGHDVAVGYRDRLLRPDRFRGAGRAALGADALRQRRPPRAHARLDAARCGDAARLRSLFETAGAAGQYADGAHGHSDRGVGGGA